MANLILNEALGRGLPFIQNVEDNTPAGCLLRLHAWVSSAADNAIRDVTDGNVDDVEAIALVAEVTNGGYANISMAASQITITVDDGNDQTDVILLDQTFTSIVAGDIWSDLTMAYDDLGTDSDIVVQVLYWWDFIVTPNSGDITVDFPATAVIRYKQA